MGRFHSEMQFPTFRQAILEEVRFSADPVRYATLGLAIERLEREGLEGEFAELGVWRGDTSHFIHLCAPNRVLHLFDTFCGFPEGLTTDKPSRFNKTSLDVVKRRLGDTRNVEFHVGFFPESAAPVMTKQFAFVMLDADCYASTLSGLEFFYPRTVPGGYIFLHDFNSPESDHGVSRAALHFLSDKIERIVEVADTWGSAFFRRVS